MPPQMSDVFLSYARPDRRWAESLASIMKAQGWSVWWDSEIRAGEFWEDDIENALKHSKCVVVLWSRHSAESHWVRAEAESALERKVLVPARLDDTKTPFGFATIQTADLSAWSGTGPDVGVGELLRGVAALLKVPDPVVETPKHPAARRRAAFAAAALIAPLLAAVGLQATFLKTTEINLEARVSGLTFTSSRPQELSDLVVLSKLEVAGFEEVILPRSRNREEQTIANDAVHGVRLQFVADDPVGAGSITLEPLVLPKGTRATVQTVAGPRECRLTLEAGNVALGASVQGQVRVRRAGAPPQTYDFGPPKPLVIQTRAAGTELDLVPEVPLPNLLPAPMGIEALSLTRLEERDVMNTTRVQNTSTVVSGTLRVVSLRARPRVLESGETLELRHATGELERVQIDNGQLVIDFHGESERVRACLRGECSNLEARWGQWLWAQHGGVVLAAAAVYGALLVAMSLRLSGVWRR